MTEQQFVKVVSDDSRICDTICDVVLNSQHVRRGVIAEAVLVASMFPIVIFLVTHVGLPWAKTAASLSEALREQFERWLAGYCERNNLAKPDKAFEKLQALVQRLQAITEGPVTDAWERLAVLIEKGSNGTKDAEDK